MIDNVCPFLTEGLNKQMVLRRANEQFFDKT